MAAAVAVFITVFLITVIIATAITFILPETYASTCKIKLDSRGHDTSDLTPMLEAAKPYDPQFIQATIAVFQSPEVLNPVIDRLNLLTVWGRKYFNGETLKTTEAMEILKCRLSLTPVRNTKLIAITVYSDDRNEAAQIANAVAESYRDNRGAAAGKLGRQPAESSPAQITDRAEPGRFPVKPNKPLNIALGVVAGIVLGALAAAIVGLFAARKR